MPPAAWRTTAIIVLMACWWMTEALPLTATALVPFLAFPLFGIMTATDIAAAYYSPILFLVLGGAIIALAIERTGLHRRLALAIVSRGGGRPAQLLFAFMAATAILSMIVSNTATTLIMMPIGLAVLHAAQDRAGPYRRLRRSAGHGHRLRRDDRRASAPWSARRPTRSPPGSSRRRSASGSIS